MQKCDQWVCKSSGSINLESNQQLESNQVRIQVKSIGLNFADIFAILGLYSATPKGEFVPGLEFCGTVIESNSDKYNENDRVMGVTRFGGYTSQIIIDHRYIRKIPDDWSFSEGSAFIVQALTAYYGLVELGNLKLDVKRKSTVLIHSVAGGVGLFAMELCILAGAKVIGTIGSEEKRQFLLNRFPDLQSEQIIVRSDANSFETQAKEALSFLQEDSFDIVFDSLGGDYFTTGYNLLSKGGRLVTYGR
jgi:NADPH:quinone reductase-like Zn-dependent oxidoreductase